MTATRERGSHHIFARVGQFVSATIVFGCGWLAIQTSDWKKIIALTLLAGAAGIVASRFQRRAR